MATQHGEIVVTVDKEDVAYLMDSGTSRTVVDVDADLSVTLRCEDSLSFEVVVDGE
jgi:hypothetical protein